MWVKCFNKHTCHKHACIRVGMCVERVKGKDGRTIDREEERDGDRKED